MHEIIERYLTGQSVLWVVTDEQNRVEYELQQAMAQAAGLNYVISK